MSLHCYPQYIGSSEVNNIDMKKLVVLLLLMNPIIMAAQQFNLLNNGTIIDSETNLMWMQRDYDAFEGNQLPYYSWDEACKWCKHINKIMYAGYNDWRIPTVSELKSLFRTKASRKKVEKVFTLKSENPVYWTCRRLNKYIATVVWTDEYYSDSQSIDPLLFEKNENVPTGHPSVLLVRTYEY